MNPQNLTSEELVQHVDNLPTPTPLERELANRLHTALVEIETLELETP